MIRSALALLALIAISSYYFAHLPVREAARLEKEVILEQVSIRLYPKSDPDAEWVFYADKIVNNPARKISKVTGLSHGARYVNGKLDLSLEAPEVSIDRYDNLTLPYATIKIPQECYTIQLGGAGKAPVRVLQDHGFTAPTFTLQGPGISIKGEGFRSDFKLEEASWERGEDIVEMDNVKECSQ